MIIMPINHFATPLNITLHAPYVMWVIVVVVNCLALTAMLLADLFRLIEIACMIMLIIYCRNQLQRLVELKQWQALIRDTKGNWWLLNQYNQCLHLTISRSSHISAHFILINAHCNGCKLTLPIWRHQQPVDSYRRLSMYLHGVPMG